MLYCPKCNAIYEDDSQKFCDTEGGRLLSAPSSIRAAVNSNGVFASILQNPAENESKSQAPRVFVVKRVPGERHDFHTDFSSKVFGEENPLPAAAAPAVADDDEKRFQILKPLAHWNKPNETLPNTEKANGGEESEAPVRNSLVGQTITERYEIAELITQDDSGIAYLAKDKINADREVIVRVITNERKDEVLSRILVEQRNTFARINHPNIAAVFDLGKLPESDLFVVIETIDGFSIREKLEVVERFEPLRAARIVRQIAAALNEIHRNGILHRNLRPENVFLIIADGQERVKITDFAVSGAIDKEQPQNVKYLAPEQLEGQTANYASDVYALALIAYEMLTGHYPFDFSTAADLLKSQKQGLTAETSAASDDLPPGANEVLKKALAYEPSARYSQAADFGDALSQVLSGNIGSAPIKTAAEIAIPKPGGLTPLPLKASKTRAFYVNNLENAATAAAAKKITLSSRTVEDLVGVQTLVGKSAQEKRPPVSANFGAAGRLWLAGAGVLGALLVGCLIWAYTLMNSSAPVSETLMSQTAPSPVALQANTAQTSVPNFAEMQSSSAAPAITQRAETVNFRNSIERYSGVLKKNYLGFTVFYPKSWDKNRSATNFLDVAKAADSGTPIEQFLVSYYDSRGNFATDSERFPKLAQDSSKKLAKLISNYRLISAGETKMSNGLGGYEMKFEGAGETVNGEQINLWGRRLFVPADSDAKNGFVITMLATSLSPDIKNVDDLATKGDLAKILETFEPSEK